MNLSYKFKAILSQYNTDNPISEIFETTFPENSIILTRHEAGVYSVSGEHFTDLNKIWCDQLTPTNQDNSIEYHRLGSNTYYISVIKYDEPIGILITTRNSNHELSDGFLNQFPVTVEVYN